MQRLAWKHHLIETIRARTAAPAIEVPMAPSKPEPGADIRVAVERLIALRATARRVLRRASQALAGLHDPHAVPALARAMIVRFHIKENTDELRISGGERYAKVYNIDYSRCIFCGFCVEACPTDAITHGHGFEIASYNVSSLIYRKEQMLVPVPQGAHFPLKAAPKTAGDGH